MTDNPELDRYEVPLSRIETAVVGWVAEARQLRESVSADILAVDNAPAALLALRTVVAAQDRVDVLQADARAVMGRARRARDQVAAEAQDQVDAAQADQSARRIEYQSSADRKAAANLAAIEDRRNARLLDRAHDVAREGYDAITAYHWQLNALREDLRATLNVFRFENSLDR